MSNAVHVYVSQADKGELVMGAGIDTYIPGAFVVDARWLRARALMPSSILRVSTKLSRPSSTHQPAGLPTRDPPVT